MTEPVQWGRQPKRKPRPSVDSPGGSPSSPVGPLETPPSPEHAATIIHAPRPAATSAPARESYEAPRPRREPSEPDEGDARLRDLVVLMARGLVDHPDDVTVEVVEPGEDACLELRVHPDDTGHVIGRQGRTARAMRLCLGAAASRLGRRASLEIAD
ncbi:MAG TPA: KH domain-containing protein [Candidatus Sulfotelmatobacter sp.]|nr:KH domain-containing protein [Candidatus Sulfotelmatobacter sp.]